MINCILYLINYCKKKLLSYNLYDTLGLCDDFVKNCIFTPFIEIESFEKRYTFSHIASF